jgi:hypothetical protein
MTEGASAVMVGEVEVTLGHESRWPEERANCGGAQHRR